MDENNIGYSNPDATFYHKLYAFFNEDKDYEFSALDSKYHFSVTIKNFIKCAVFKKMIKIPDNCTKLDMEIIYEDHGLSEQDLAYSLKDNPYYSTYFTTDEPEEENGAMKAILMKPETIQFYNDVFNNPFGVKTMTAEDLAKEIFHGSHCNITSNIKED